MTSSKDIVIGVDQGTSNTKVLVLGRSGEILAAASRPIATHAPRPGWVEQDPQAMFANVVACVREALALAHRAAGDVAGLGLANQTETLVVWDRVTGSPVLPAIVWQCRRGEEEIARLRGAETLALIRGRTGLDLDPTFTAAKLKWVDENRPEVASGLRRGAYLFGTVDCWLLWRLTGGTVYATDASNASRTMLFDIESLAWDRELESLFGLCLGAWPEPRPSSGPFGQTSPALFGAAIPITGALGDQPASLFGHGCFGEGQMKVTYGTGAFLWVNAGRQAGVACDDGLIRTIAWQLEQPCYALEGFIMYAGAALGWLATRLGIEGGGSAVAAAAAEAGASEGVIMVPAFQGLAAPWWRPEARAALLGLSEATTVAHLCHAGLEAVCYQVRMVLEAVTRRSRRPIAAVNVDGGPTRSPYLMQLQADVLERPLACATLDAMTPYGAALMAGLGAQLWDSPDRLRAIMASPRAVVPDPANAAACTGGYQRWRRAVDALISSGAGAAAVPGAR